MKETLLSSPAAPRNARPLQALTSGFAPRNARPLQPTLRFAPSPNGYLHLGHALSALIVEGWAKALDGAFLLRIEDTDLTRRRDPFVDAIYEDLAWLGISWQTPVRMQSEHLGDYQKALQTLWDRGLVYPARASRRQIKQAAEQAGALWPRDPDGGPHYPFKIQDLAAKPDTLPKEGALRLDMQAALAACNPAALTLETLASPTATPSSLAVDPNVWGDVLLRGTDRPVTYHLAVVVDDALQGITHVVRGQDMEASTSIHRLLQALLNLPTPFYHHHRLVLGEDGRKLSKSEGAKSLRALREAGMTPKDVKAQLTGL